MNVFLQQGIGFVVLKVADLLVDLLLDVKLKALLINDFEQF